jgi:hypothetical protein
MMFAICLFDALIFCKKVLPAFVGVDSGFSQYRLSGLAERQTRLRLKASARSTNAKRICYRELTGSKSVKTD